jgi:hypothetical protein
VNRGTHADTPVDQLAAHQAKDLGRVALERKVPDRRWLGVLSDVEPPPLD